MRREYIENHKINEPDDDFGPVELFTVPLGVIEKVIALIISGEIVKYTYDAENETLIER